MEFSDHTSPMTPQQLQRTINPTLHPLLIIYLSILIHPERVESIIPIIGVFRHLHLNFGLLTFDRILVL